MSFIILNLGNINKILRGELEKFDDGRVMEFETEKEAKIYAVQNDIERSDVLDTTRVEDFEKAFKAGATSVLMGFLEKIGEREAQKQKESQLHMPNQQPYNF